MLSKNLENAYLSVQVGFCTSKLVQSRRVCCNKPSYYGAIPNQIRSDRFPGGSKSTSMSLTRLYKTEMRLPFSSSQPSYLILKEDANKVANYALLSQYSTSFR